MRITWWISSSNFAALYAQGTFADAVSALNARGIEIDVVDASSRGALARAFMYARVAQASDLIHFVDSVRPTRLPRGFASLMMTPALYGDIRADSHTDGMGGDERDRDAFALSNALAALYSERLGIDRRTILGVAIEVTSRIRAVRRVDDAITSRQPLRVAFANAHTLNIAATSDTFRNALRSFFVLNDGLGLDLASRWKVGKRFDENLNGTDFVPRYLDTSRHQLKIFLLGSSQEVADTAARKIAERWPRHQIVGTRHGFFANRDEETEAAAKIRQSGADLVLVGMGNPLQEMWIDRNGAATGAPALFGVGAFLDFTSGRAVRAPNWVRAIRCEWVWRLAREPRRLWRRYILGNAMFLVRVMRETRAAQTAG